MGSLVELGPHGVDVDPRGRIGGGGVGGGGIRGGGRRRRGGGGLRRALRLGQRGVEPSDLVTGLVQAPAGVVELGLAAFELGGDGGQLGGVGLVFGGGVDDWGGGFGGSRRELGLTLFERSGPRFQLLLHPGEPLELRFELFPEGVELRGAVGQGGGPLPVLGCEGFELRGAAVEGIAELGEFGGATVEVGRAGFELLGGLGLVAEALLAVLQLHPQDRQSLAVGLQPGVLLVVALTLLDQRGPAVGDLGLGGLQPGAALFERLPLRGRGVTLATEARRLRFEFRFPGLQLGPPALDLGLPPLHLGGVVVVLPLPILESAEALLEIAEQVHAGVGGGAEGGFVHGRSRFGGAGSGRLPRLHRENPGAT